MKILVDAFGGDNAPDEIIKGSVMAAEEYGIDIILVGSKSLILSSAEKQGISPAVSKMEILECSDVIATDDEPTALLKEKAESSMAVGLKALAEGKADAFASAGNSGALVVGATMIVKRIKGIKRVSFSPIMPGSNGVFMLSDGGANNECRPVMLQQFAQMSTVYMQHVIGIENPRVALVNVGAEEHKGDALRQEAHQLLKETANINFIGNIEARDIPKVDADIVITDGFTGNVILKLYEGLASTLLGMVKGIFTKSLKNKLAAAVVLKDMNGLKKSMDYNEYGGAPIMGASKPIYKIHGSAKAVTVKNALRLTKNYVNSGFVDKVADSFK